MVVVSGSRVRKVTAYPSAGTPTLSPSPPAMTAKAVLTCRPNSHPFQERTLTLNTPAKIGRSVARARVSSTNAIFDCKVLSRHHALIWYENGKFYLQDTKSSNGTFINNNRLSEGGKESVPHEVWSGDIVQFGVDVVENNRKVTHGCVIAVLKLYLPDGAEAKPNSSTANTEELVWLSQQLREASQREQQLESKLNTLQRLVEQTKRSAEVSWKAAVDEDRLLSHVEILESLLRTYSKNCGDDSLKEELVRLQEDKNAYQIAAKRSIERLEREKLSALDNVEAHKRRAENALMERLTAIEQYTTVQEEMRRLTCDLVESQIQNKDLLNKLKESEQKDQELQLKLTELKATDKESYGPVMKMLLEMSTENETKNDDDFQENGSVHTDSDSTISECEDDKSLIATEKPMNDMQEEFVKDEIDDGEVFHNDKLITYQTFESAFAEDEEKYKLSEITVDKYQEAIFTLKMKLKEEIENREKLAEENKLLKQNMIETQQSSKETKNEAQQMTDKINALLAELEIRPTISKLEDCIAECEKLKQELKEVKCQKEILETKYSELAKSNNPDWSDYSRITELEEELVLVKEKHAQCQIATSALGKELQAAKEQINALKNRSQTEMFLYIAPFLLVIAYLYISSLMA